MSDGSSSGPLPNLTGEPQPTSAPAPAVGVTWGPVVAIVMTLVVFAVGEFGAGLLITLVPRLLGWSSLHGNDWLMSVGGQFAYVLLAESLTIALLWWYLRRHKGVLAGLGFKRWPQWRDAGFVVVGFVVYFALVAVVSTWAAQHFHVDLSQKQDLGFNSVSGGGERLMTFASLVLLPPFVEETMFRGFLFGGLRRKLSFPMAALLVSLLFASLHLLEGESGLLWVAGIDTFVLSLVLCFVREKTGNLWAGIGIHMLKNCVAFLYLYVFVVR